MDCGDGTYEASYAVEKAGPYEVSLFLGTEASTHRVVCEPGRVDYSQCRVEGATDNSRWLTGAPLRLTVTRMDRYGNRVPRREGLAQVILHVEDDNDAAIAFYEAQNFARVKVDRDLRQFGTALGLNPDIHYLFSRDVVS